MIKHEDFIFMFGGIQDVTKEKNDIYIFQLNSNKWSKIHTTTNSIYDCSPTLKRNDKVPTVLIRELKVPKTLPARNYRPKNLIEA